MARDWIEEELKDVDLVDKRLEDRFCKLLDSLSSASTASIPAATNDQAEMVAAYRFFDNERVNFANVLAPHIESSYRRVQKQKVALLVQDTTELDLTRPHSKMEGAGTLQNGRRCGSHMHLLHAFTGEGITVNAVLVREIKPNGVDQPIQWLLLTSLATGSRELVELIIEYYLIRWMIELSFKVLKSGCRIEERRFEHIDRFETALALYMIIAWRSLYVCRMSRVAAEKRCTLIYTESEWKGVWMIINKTSPPRRPPSLLEMTKLIASLGGYIVRQNAGPPGPQTVWLGLQAMQTIASCYLTFGPGAKKKNCV